MELNQNLADFFSNNNKQGSGGETPKPSASPGGLSLDLANFFPSQQAAPRQAAPTSGLDPERVNMIADTEGLSPTQKRVMTALLHQESGFGRNARTSVDGAQGPGQIIPATFRRYAKAGEDIGNADHNLAVMARIVKDLGTKFGDDPGRIATGYFSGEGNVNRGSGQAWRNDAADGNRKRVSSYVSDVLTRLSGISDAQAAEKPAAPKADLPDLGKAKPWAEIAKNPEYQALDTATKAQAKAAYFDYWIAPHAGGNARQMRQQFLDMQDPTPGLMERAGEMAGKVGEAIKSVLPGMDETAQGPTAEPTAEELEQASKPAFNYRKPGGRTPAERDPNAINMPGSVMDGTVPQDNTLPTTSKAPVRPEVRAAFNARWDAATPEQRATMAKQEGVMGQLARERAGIFARQDELAKGMPTDNALRDVDPRVEARRAELIDNGEDARVADTLARVASGRGVLPGQEIAAVGVMQDGSGTRQGQIMQMQADLQNAPQGEKPEGAEVATNAIMRGIYQSAAIGKGLVALGAKAVGADDLALSMLKGYFESSASAKQYSAQIEDFTKIEKLSDVPTYILEGVLENLPQLAVTIGTGSVGGLLARKFGEKAVAKMVAEQATKELSRRMAIGAAAGAGVSSIGMESGSIYGDIARETGQERPGIAASFGVVAGALDAIPAFRAATKILGKESVSWATKEIAKRYGKEALVQLGGEGFTEFLQTWVEKGAVSYVDGRPLFTKENLVEAVDAFLKGGASGVAIGVGSQGVSDIRNAPNIRAERAAEAARTAALNKWNTQGFVQPGRTEPTISAPTENLTEDGRIEPALGAVPPNIEVAPSEMAPVDINPMVQTADSIVSELASQAGVPLETVLPSSPQQTTGPESFSDQEVLDFAASRYQQLREKRDGRIESVPGENGVVDQDMPGVGLTESEQRELDALLQSRNNPSALRKLYGFDQASSTDIRSDVSANQTFGQTPAPVPGQAEQPTAGQQFPATMEPGLVAAQSQENANVQTQINAQQDGLAQPAVSSDGQPGGPAPVQESAAQAPGSQVGAEGGQRYEGLPAEGAVTPQSVAIQAAQISRRESPLSVDPRVDRIGAQENYLQELARSNPEAARSIAQELRNDPQKYSEAAGVLPEMIGRYASIIEQQLLLNKPRTEKEARARREDGTLKTKQEYTPDEWSQYTKSVIDAKLDTPDKPRTEKEARAQRAQQKEAAAVAPKTEKEARAKKAEAQKTAVRDMTDEGRAKDGKPINGGDVFRTSSGRETTPYPKQKQDRYASQWLIDNAVAEAEARGDSFNVGPFKSTKPSKGGTLTTADRDSMLMYLFGEQPAVQPSILKPLTDKPAVSANTAVAPKTEREAREARRKTNILTPDGGKVEAQWDVVDADSVKASLKEGVSQPRDRTRAASNKQVLEIANKPDFERLSDTSKTMDYGAPTLSADGLIVGGNGRFEGVSQAYEGGKAAEYLDALLKSAPRFGLDADAIRGMKKPILVRRITQEADTRKLAIQSNQAAGLQMSDMEQAALDAERMTDLDRIEVSENGDIPLTTANVGAIRDALSGYNTNELAAMMAADGTLSQSGVRRVRNAILYSAYGKSDSLSRLIESPDADMKNIGTALVRAGAQLAKVRRAIADGNIPANYDIAADLTAAIETLSSLRASGTNLADYLAQNDMFGGGISDEAKTIIQFLNDNLRSAKSISEYLNAYAQAVLSAEGASGGLFDDVTLPSKLEVLQNAGQRFAAEKAAAKSQQSIFDQPAGKTGQQDRQQSEGQTGNARSDEEGAGQVTQSSQKEKAPAGQTGKQAMPDSTQPFVGAVSSEPDTLRSVPDTLDQAKEKYAQKVEKNANNQNELSNSVPITDFGKKIGGAKKDLWGAFSDNMGKVSDEDIGNQPLSKSWPEPDYQALLDGGADPWAVAFMHATRDAIPAKPRTGYKVKQWADLVRDLRRHSINLASGKMPVDRIKAIIDSMRSSVMRDISGRIDLYLAVGHSKSLAGVSIGRGEYSIFHGVEYKPAKVIWSVEKKTAATAFSNFPRMLATGSTRDEAIQKFKDKFASMEIAKPAAKEVSFDVWSTKGQPGFKVGKKVGRNYILLAGPFDTVKEARAYRDNHQADLVAKLEKAKEIPQERRDTNNPRVGEDMRGGQDVTPEMFGEAFGFRGVEFGNWVDQGRRQKDLNEAYDALMDMAAIIGVNPKALSLNGELGIAFGARGSGGVHPAAAHYEPDYVVINLTKKSGAGSLGHEWWHALDNYFSRMRKQGSKMMTEALDVSLAARGSKFEAVGDVRREMIAAFGEVMRSIRTTAIKARSSKLDSKRTKEYWTTDAEMSARAFESYLISKLQDQNASNDYLANIVDEKTWAAAEKLGFELDGSYPYPTAGEVPAIRAGFDAFFDTIEQKETDSGVMLYNLRRSQTSTPEFKKWFGDSKVVDADGKPLVVYHGTASDFNVFNTGRGAIYFAADKDAAQAYANYNEDGDSGPRVVNAYLRIENPMVIDKKWADKNITDEDGAIDWTALDNVAYEAGQNGHDGLILKGLPDFAGMNENDKRVEREYDQYIVFNPTQIKSATGNNGQFDANDPNITRDISRSPSYHFEGTEQTKRVNALAKLKALEEKRDAGKITDAEYRLGVQQLIASMQDQKDERIYRQVVNGRRRGTDWVIAKLRRGLADGTVLRNEVEFAEWLLDQNPNLGNELGVSVKSPNDDGVSGQYNPASRVMTLMSGTLEGDTTVHEIMHHTERMMPHPVQDAIVKEWQRAWDAAYKKGDEKFKAALNDMLEASLGSRTAHQRVILAMQSGTLNYGDHYQLYSPSEYWAVNSTRILSGRYKADASWVKQAIQWFKEFVQRARGFLGLRSDAPIIKALNRVMNGEGYFQTNASMLVQQDIAQWRNEKKADQKQDSTKDLTVQNLNPQAIDEANTALSTSGTLAFSRFTERFGTGPVNHAEAKIAAEELTGLHLGIEAVPNSDLPSYVPMRFNLETRQIEFDPNREMTQAFAVQSYIEELLHAVDALSNGRAISVTSTRLHPETGDIGLEAMRAYNNGPNALREFLDYPLSPAIGLNYQRIRAELFARLGVMYFADPGLMKELLPNAHQSYEQLFGVKQTGPTEYVRGKIWLPVPSASRGQVRGQSRSNEYAQNDARGIGQNEQARRGLERLRAGIARAFQAKSEGGVVQGGFFETRSNNTPENDPGKQFVDATRKTQRDALNFWGNQKGSLKTFGVYDKTLSTQFNKALKDPHFGKVFGYVNAMQNEVSLTSIRPAELAPGVLPRIDNLKSAFKTLVKGKRADKDLTQAANAIFAGTLAGKGVLSGRVWSEQELRSRFGLTDKGVDYYQQARNAIDASLDEVAAAEAYAMAQRLIPKGLRRQIIDNPSDASDILGEELAKQVKMLQAAIRAAKRTGEPEQRINDLEASLALYQATDRNVEKIFLQAKNLKQAGYAPLMRFGKYTVLVQSIDPATGEVLRDENGESMTEFYSQYETESEAMAAKAMLEKEFKDEDVRITAGTKSEMSYQMYAGISPETLALFAEAVGAASATQKYYQLALSERSALKRRLERKNIEGFNDDLPRVLSNFITSNGRFAAQRYYMRDLNNAIKFIPKAKGDVLDEAIKLKQFVTNPSDPAAPVSTVMFAWFLGGSVAAASVNLTQPFLMTAPYLSQFGVDTATKAITKALPIALGKKPVNDAELRGALKRASQEGIVDAQEIFHLYSIGAQGVASGAVSALSRVPGVGKVVKRGSEDARARINGFLTIWGSMFAAAEGFNRRLTFVAAWEVAKANGENNPYAFAVRAVNETQGIYNKVNRPNWARHPAGRIILTFKMIGLVYIELLSRLWKRGGPEGKRAALTMLAVLVLASGVEGLPFAQDLDDLIDTIGQVMGFDTNMRRSKRRLAYGILGKTMGDLLLYGASSQLPLDFSGRLGLGNLIPGTGLLKPSNESGRTREVAEVFGPAAGLATQIAEAYDAAAESNWGKAGQNLAPTAIKNALAAAEMAKKGYATDYKGRKTVETDATDVAVKAIGFNPTKNAELNRRTMPQQQDIALQKKTESSIVELWARGLADRDQEMVNKAQKRLDDWNKSNKDTPIVITPNQIRQRTRDMMTDKDSRLFKKAPREMRGTLGLDMVE